MANVPNVLVVNATSPHKTMMDLVNAAKAKPGAINFTSTGSGSAQHLAGALFESSVQVDMVHVPYRTSPIADIVGGQVDTLMEPIATGFPLISSGKAVPLAFSGTERFPALPNVPTLSEIVPGLSMMSWHGIWASSATPAAIVNRVNAVFVEASKDADVSKRIRDLNSEPLGMSRAEMAQAVKRDAEIYSRIVKAKNIKVD